MERAKVCALKLEKDTQDLTDEARRDEGAIWQVAQQFEIFSLNTSAAQR